MLRPAVRSCGALSLAAVVGLVLAGRVASGNERGAGAGAAENPCRVRRGVSNGNLWTNMLASIQRVLIGFFIGAALALILGALAGWFKWWGWILNPIIDAIRPIPALAYIPLVIVWVGIGEPSRLIIIALACSSRAWSMRAPGCRSRADLRRRARTLGASKWRVFTTVAIPSAIPYFIAGMRTGVSTGFLALVAAELIAAPSGSAS
jgi:ABC-type nitrate/sulfonate/bicarbonate transport system permease component